MRTLLPPLLAILLHLALAIAAPAQSGIRWSSNPQSSTARARELGVPVMFWVTERADVGDSVFEDFIDAQHDSFRDPVVRAIVERFFVPCRVARTSRTMPEAERLGLPTNFGLYIAIVTTDGKLIAQIDPGQVAEPEALAERLAAASRAYRESVYIDKLKPWLTDPAAPKTSIAQAVRTAWMLHIYAADKDIVALLARPDVNTQERSRLYQLFAAFATPPCITALLDAAPKDKAAAAALDRAEPLALATLLDSLPPATGEVTERHLAAYRALTSLARIPVAKGAAYWPAATPEQRTAEVERVRTIARAVLDAWQEREGRWR